MDSWQNLPTHWQDSLILMAYLLPVLLLGLVLFYRLSPYAMIATLLRRYKKVNGLIVIILGICLSVSLAIQATATAYKHAMAKVANRFELVVTAPGSKIDMMLSTVYLQPVAAPLLSGEIYTAIANDDQVAVATPIAYGDSYAGYPIVGSTNSFIKYLSDNDIEGRYFTHQNEAIVGLGVNLAIGDTFVPQHGIHKSFAPQLSAIRGSSPDTSADTSTTDTTAGTKVVFSAPASTVSTAVTEQSNKQTLQPPAYFCPDDSLTPPTVSLSQQLTPRSVSDLANRPALQGLIGPKTDNPIKNHDKKQVLLAVDGPATKPKAPKASAHRQTTLTVVGKMPLTHSPWDKAIITPVESVWHIHGLPTGHAPDDSSLGEPFDKDYFAGTPAILVHPHKRFQAYPLSMKYTNNQSMAFIPATVLSKLNAQLDDVTDVLSRVAFLTICLVLSLAIVTIVLLAKLFEKHFWLLQALGSPKRFITSILWGYVTTLAAIATVLGGVLGYGLSLLLAAYIESYLSVLLPVRFSWTEFTLCALFFALSSLLGLIPALTRFNKG